VDETSAVADARFEEIRSICGERLMFLRMYLRT